MFRFWEEKCEVSRESKKKEEAIEEKVGIVEIVGVVRGVGGNGRGIFWG